MKRKTEGEGGRRKKREEDKRVKKRSERRSRGAKVERMTKVSR